MFLQPCTLQQQLQGSTGYQSRHQKKERKTHPKVEEEVAEPLKQQEVEGKFSRYQCNFIRCWLLNVEGWVSSNSNNEQKKNDEHVKDKKKHKRDR